MGKTLYFDCFSGASGDMVIGALLDLGMPLDGLKAALGSLAIAHGGVSAERVLRAGVFEWGLLKLGCSRSRRFPILAITLASGPR